MAEDTAKNVLGEPLQLCGAEPATGFFRDGYCRTCEQDRGLHTVCAEVTQEFLDYSLSKGNDLITPRPEFSFPGLKPGDRWCLCAARWLEAQQSACAPSVVLASTDARTLEVVSLDDLKSKAIDLN